MFFPYSVEHERDYLNRQRWPLLTIGLMAVMAGIHALVFIGLDDPAQRLDVLYRFGASRFDLQVYQLFTCNFLHGGWLHLFANLYFFWVYGTALEKLLGAGRYAVLFIVGGVASIMVHLVTVSAFYVDEPAVGASGAISAIMGAFLVLMPMAKLETLYFSPISFRPLVMLMPAWLVLGVWFAGQLMYTMGIMGEIEGIAFWAHVGGFGVGAVLATIHQHFEKAGEAHGEAAEREVFVHAFTAIGEANAGKAAQLLPAEPARASAEFHATEPLLAAIVDIYSRGDTAAGFRQLERAFMQAKDYGSEAKQMGIYMQLLRAFPLSEIPADIHRDAGYLAASMKLPGLATTAWQAAILGGLRDGVDQVRENLARLAG